MIAEISHKEILEWLHGKSDGHLAVLQWPDGRMTGLCRIECRHLGSLESVLRETAKLLGMSEDDWDKCRAISLNIDREEWDKSWSNKVVDLGR